MNQENASPALSAINAPQAADMALSNPSLGFLQAHDHSGGALSVAGYDVEKIINYAAIVTGLMATAVILAPLALPSVGIGQDTAKQLIDECCSNLGNNTGAAGAVNGVIKGIPVVGSYLTTEGGKNWAVPAVTMLGGYAAGSLISKIEKDHGRSGKIGAMVRIGSMGLGITLALPALMPGIAHGTMFLGRVSGIPETAQVIAKAMGNTGYCSVGTALEVLEKEGVISMADSSRNSLIGSASVMAGHLPCVVAAGIASALAGASVGSNVEKLQREREAQAAAGKSL